MAAAAEHYRVTLMRLLTLTLRLYCSCDCPVAAATAVAAAAAALVQLAAAIARLLVAAASLQRMRPAAQHRPHCCSSCCSAHCPAAAVAMASGRCRWCWRCGGGAGPLRRLRSDGRLLCRSLLLLHCRQWQRPSALSHPLVHVCLTVLFLPLCWCPIRSWRCDRDPTRAASEGCSEKKKKKLFSSRHSFIRPQRIMQNDAPAAAAAATTTQPPHGEGTADCHRDGCVRAFAAQREPTQTAADESSGGALDSADNGAMGSNG